MSHVAKDVGLAAAPFTGGASLALEAGGGGGGGFKNFLSGIPIIGGLFGPNQADKAASSALTTEQQVSGAALPYAKNTLKRAESGQLTPDEQASVDQWKQGQTSQWNQYLANAGLENSSSQVDITGKVNQEALAMSHDMLQQDITTSLQALGITESGAAAAANLALQQQTNTNNALLSVFQTLGIMSAIPGAPPGATPATGVAGAAAGAGGASGVLDAGTAIATDAVLA